MSQFTAEVFGLTQEELVEFLNVQVVNVVPPPPPTEPPTPGSGAYGILVFSIVLLVIAAMSFVVSAVLWYSYRKRTQEVRKNLFLRRAKYRISNYIYCLVLPSTKFYLTFSTKPGPLKDLVWSRTLSKTW